MDGRPHAGALAVLASLVVIQAGIQLAQGRDRDGGMAGMWWPDDLMWRAVLVAGLVAIVALIAGFVWPSRPGERRGGIGSGISPTMPILPPVFAIAVIVLVYGPVPDGEYPAGSILLGAALIAVAVWLAFAAWRGGRSSPQGVAPELYESLKTEYLALRAALFTPDDPNRVQEAMADGQPQGTPSATDGPLPPDRIPGYLLAIGKELGFEQVEKSASDTFPDRLIPSPRAWNTGSPYLQCQRKLAYVRDSLIAMETDKYALGGYAFALGLRVSGSHLPDATKTSLIGVLDDAKGRIETGTNPALHARSLYFVAATLSSYVYSRQKALLQMQMHQHWLVVVVQMIGAVILAIAVLAGASAGQVSAAVLFYLVGAGSGILSLLHVRQSVPNAEVGDDYGLFRIELARAFTLSGMAAVIAVFLIANLPVLAGAGVFDPPAVTETPTGTPAPTEAPPAGSPTGTPAAATGPADEGTPGASPVATPEAARADTIVRAFKASRAFPVRLLAQDTGIDPNGDGTEPGQGDDDDETGDRPDWRPLRDIFAFSNLGGLLVALLAGWVPERLFRSLTEHGNRLRLDIQSVSRSGV